MPSPLDKPLISVGIISHNRAEFLAEAVKSAQSQRGDFDLEILVVDNGSTDNSREVLASIEDPRLRVFELNENTGEAGGRNHAIEKMNGRFMIWLDDDDVLLPGAISSHLQALAARPDAHIIYGNLEVCDQELNKIDEWRYQGYEQRLVLYALLFFSRFPNGGTLFSRAAFEMAGPYDASFTRCTDYDFWMRAADANCQFLHHDDFVYSYRSHQGNFLRGEDSPDFNYCNALVIERMLDRTPLQRIFPMFDWDTHAELSRGRGLAIAALVLTRYRAFEAAAQIIQRSLAAAETPEGLAAHSVLLQLQGKLEESRQQQLLALLQGNQHLAQVFQLLGFVRRN